MVKNKLESIREYASRDVHEALRLFTAGLAGVAANQATNMDLRPTFFFIIAVILLFSFLLFTFRLIYGDHRQQQPKVAINHNIMNRNAGCDAKNPELNDELEKQQAS